MPIVCAVLITRTRANRARYSPLKLVIYRLVHEEKYLSSPRYPGMTIEAHGPSTDTAGGLLQILPLIALSLKPSVTSVSLQALATL